MCAKKEIKFKRCWERKAKEDTQEEVVFSKTLGAKWTRDSDKIAFDDITEFLEIKKGCLLLDIGCGPLARAEIHFSLRGCKIIGLDVSATTLKKAKENMRKYGNLETVDFVLADAEFLPFAENKFDFLLCIGTISHLPTVESVKHAVREMRQVARIQGKMYITWWVNLYSFFGIQNVLMSKVLDSLKVDRVQILKFKGINEINVIFNYAGLNIKKMRYGELIGFPQHLLYVLPRFMTKILDRVATVLNEFHKNYTILSFFSNVFEVMCENVSPSPLQLVKIDSYYQFF